MELILAVVVIGVTCMLLVGMGVHIAANRNKAPAGPAAPAALDAQAQQPKDAGGGQWLRGKATYYTSANGGPLGHSGKRLTAFKSVAVKTAEYERTKGRKVEIKGVGTLVVEDSCPDAKCMDFDIFVGDNINNRRQLPNWQAGNIPIEYRWV